VDLSVPPKLGLPRIILQLQDSSLLARSSLAAPTGIFITHSIEVAGSAATVGHQRHSADKSKLLLQVSDAASRLLATSQSRARQQPN
jgi:hypothetical protein